MIPLSSIGMVFVIVATMLILVLPRRWAVIPLIVGVYYMVLGQGIEIGPFSFFVIRILILAGLVRVLIRGERPTFGMNKLDWLMVWWGIWAIAASGFRTNPSQTLVYNLGLVFNACGVYFLVRTFLTSIEDVKWLCRMLIIILIPIAIEMMHEKLTGHNLFSILGGVPENPYIRHGRLRAQGPFAHAILAGSVGAVCLPLAVALWREHRLVAILGILSCLTIAVASASSGPLLSSMAALLAMAMWSFRSEMRMIRWAAVGVYLCLELVMRAPVYYLLARIDLTGGSTGWHRAELINSSIRHLSEWWLAGTDYTRHWMPTGVLWSPNHADITNYYLSLGVKGGLPLMLLFVGILTVAFSQVGKVILSQSVVKSGRSFSAWALGASLFACAATAVSVSFFDQSFAIPYIILASIGTLAGVVDDPATKGLEYSDLQPRE